MSLRTKIFFILLALTVAAFVGQGFVMRFIVYPQFLLLEEEGARHDMARIQRGLSSTIKNLDVLCSDWAAWNDALDFVEERNRTDFVKNNIPDEFFGTASIDYIHFINLQGKTVYRRAIDPITGLDFETKGFGPHADDRGLLFIESDSEQEVAAIVKSGLVFVGGIPEPLLLVVRPIIQSSSTGPIHGTLVMGRFLRMASLQQDVGVDFRLLPIESLELGSGEQQILAQLQAGEATPILKYVDDTIVFYSQVNGIYSTPLYLIVGQKPAEIMVHGASACHTAMLCYLAVSISFLMLVFFLLSRIVTRPLLSLHEKTGEVVKSGNFSGEIKLEGQGEIVDLGMSINELLLRIVGHEKLLLDANNKLLEQSLTDPLTGLSNRRDFDVYMENEWARMRRNKLPLSVVMCDVDYFKKYNDAYGHLKGDTCLQALAKALADVVNRPADLPARYGGEEFVLVLPETDAAGAKFVAEKICVAIRDLKIEHVVSSVSPWVTMSVGAATIIPNETHNSDYLVRMADEALYQAKEQGRNQVASFLN